MWNVTVLPDGNDLVELENNSEKVAGPRTRLIYGEK